MQLGRYLISVEAIYKTMEFKMRGASNIRYAEDTRRWG